MFPFDHWAIFEFYPMSWNFFAIFLWHLELSPLDHNILITMFLFFLHGISKINLFQKELKFFSYICSLRICVSANVFNKFLLCQLLNFQDFLKNEKVCKSIYWNMSVNAQLQKEKKNSLILLYHSLFAVSNQDRILCELRWWDIPQGHTVQHPRTQFQWCNIVHFFHMWLDCQNHPEKNYFYFYQYALDIKRKL